MSLHLKGRVEGMFSPPLLLSGLPVSLRRGAQQPSQVFLPVSEYLSPCPQLNASDTSVRRQASVNGLVVAQSPMSQRRPVEAGICLADTVVTLPVKGIHKLGRSVTQCLKRGRRMLLDNILAPPTGANPTWIRRVVA